MKKNIIKGLVLNIMIASVSLYLYKTDMNKILHISSFLFAIVIGMLVANFTNIAQRKDFQYGINFSSKKLLRFGIILIGFKLSLIELTRLGLKGIIFISLLVPTTLFVTMWLGKKMGLSRNMSVCLAAGTSICGASAVATIGPIIDADEKEIAFGIGAITFFGTIAMFVFPIIFRTFGLDSNADFYGAWVGASLPDVAEVVAASGAVGSTAAESMAILTKLTRVLFLMPISIGFTLWNGGKEGRKVETPWYIIAFVGVVIFNSFDLLPKEMLEQIKNMGNLILTVAMASLGLKTNIKDMVQAGIKPFIVGFLGAIVIQILGFTGSYLLFYI